MACASLADQSGNARTPRIRCTRLLYEREFTFARMAENYEALYREARAGPPDGERPLFPTAARTNARVVSTLLIMSCSRHALVRIGVPGR